MATFESVKQSSGFERVVDQGADQLQLSTQQRAQAKNVGTVQQTNFVSVVSTPVAQNSTAKQEPPAKTEVVQASTPSQVAQASQGYAVPPAGTPAPAAPSYEAFKLDSDQVLNWIPDDPRLRSFLADRARFDFEGGKACGSKIFTKANFADYVKKQLRNNPVFRQAFEKAFGVQVDFRLPAKDNEVVVTRHAASPVTPPPSQSAPPPAPAGVPAGPAQSPSSGATQSTPSDGKRSSYLDPNIGAYRECLNTIFQNWEVFDTAVGVKDQLMTRANLKAIYDNPATSAELKSAAKFLLEHEEYFNRLEMAAATNGNDGIIGKRDVGADLDKANKEIAQYGMPSPSSGAAAGSSGATAGAALGAGSGSSSPGGTASSTDSLTNIATNRSMTIEDRMETILSRSLNSLDQEIEATMTLLATPDAKGKDGKPINSQLLQFKLQRLMERRTQMFTLLSNMSEKFNEMAKTALANMGRA